MKQQDAYKEVRTFIGEGYVVRVHIPDITEEEMARRRKKAEKSAARLLAAYLQINNK